MNAPIKDPTIIKGNKNGISASTTQKATTVNNALIINPTSL
jgi:hypothetical protein